MLPFLNPIELSFNAVKTNVKSREMLDRGELIDSIKRGIESVVTAENAKQWFAHCTCFYPQCAIGIPFRGFILDPELTDPNNVSNQQQQEQQRIEPNNLLSL